MDCCKPIYRAEDGTEFDNPEACKAHSETIVYIAIGISMHSSHYKLFISKENAEAYCKEHNTKNAADYFTPVLKAKAIAIAPVDETEPKETEPVQTPPEKSWIAKKIAEYTS